MATQNQANCQGREGLQRKQFFYKKLGKSFIESPSVVVRLPRLVWAHWRPSWRIGKETRGRKTAKRPPSAVLAAARTAGASTRSLSVVARHREAKLRAIAHWEAVGSTRAETSGEPVKPGNLMREGDDAGEPWRPWEQFT